MRMNGHLAFIGRDGAGHVNPTLPVVTELVRRGHRVTYAVGAPFAEAVRRAGARYLPLPANDFRGGRRGQGALRDPDVVAMLTGMVMEGSDRELAVLREGFAADRPDAVCYDGSSLSGAMLADLLAVPAVQLAPNFAANEHYSLLQEFVPDPARLAASAADAQERVRAFTSALGVTRTLGTVLTRTAADLTIVFVPRQFQYHGETFGDDYVFVGPSDHDRAESGDWRPPAPGSRLLFVALGTMLNEHPEFFRLCIEALGGTDWRVAMAIGDRVDRAALGDIPANFDVRPHFPQLEVLKHAGVFVTHAGMNSTMEAVLNQVPTVAVPQTPEQAANARRLAELGLGMTLTEQTAPALRRAVTEVDQSEQIRKNLAEMAGHFRAAGEAAAAADAIEGLIRH